jgi:hypothetical protein
MLSVLSFRGLMWWLSKVFYTPIVAKEGVTVVKSIGFKDWIDQKSQQSLKNHRIMYLNRFGFIPILKPLLISGTWWVGPLKYKVLLESMDQHNHVTLSSKLLKLII